MGHLSSVYPRSAPNLLSAPAAALPGDASGGGERGSGIPAQHRNHLAAIIAAARSSPATTDQRARTGGGPRQSGRAAGFDLWTERALPPEYAAVPPPLSTER